MWDIFCLAWVVRDHKLHCSRGSPYLNTFSQTYQGEQGARRNVNGVQWRISSCHVPKRGGASILRGPIEIESRPSHPPYSVTAFDRVLIGMR